MQQEALGYLGNHSPFAPGVSVLPGTFPGLVLAPARDPFPGARGGGAKALRSVSQAEALGGVSQVEASDVEDVLQVGGVGGVGPQEGLQRCQVT